MPVLGRTRIILQPFLDLTGTSLGCPILLAEYPRIIPRMLVCYEGPALESYGKQAFCTWIVSIECQGEWDGKNPALGLL